MRIKPLHKLLLVAVLVLGQWLAIAHDYQHPALGGDETCQVCLHGPNLQNGPAATAALTGIVPETEAPPALATAPVLSRRHTHTAIRAPPVRLV